MPSETHGRPGFAAVLVLVLLATCGLYLPHLLYPPASVELGEIRSLTGVRDGAAPALVRWTLGLDQRLVGDAPAVVAHRHSFLGHLLATLGLLALLSRLGAQRVPAVLWAGLFAVHPALQQVVVLSPMRSTVLAGCAGVWALHQVAAASATARVWHWLVAALLGAVSASCSPWAVVLPLLGYAVGMRVHGRGIAPAVTLAASVGAGLWFAGVWPDGYDWAALWPAWQSLVAPPALDLVDPSPSEFAWLGAALVGISLAAAVVLRGRRPTAALGAAVCAVAIAGAGVRCADAGPDRLPVLLAILGLSVAGGGLRAPRALWWPIGGCVLAAASVCAVRAPLFHDPEALWRSAAPRSPLARVRLADCLAARGGGFRDRALDLLKDALPQLRDGRVKLHGQRLRVRLLAAVGENESAAAAARDLCGMAAAVGDREAELEGCVLAAECATALGRTAEVDAFLDRASKLDADHPEVLAARAERGFGALVQTAREAGKTVDSPAWVRQDDPALAPIRASNARALQIDPKCFRAVMLDGRLLEATGQVLAAQPRYEEAVRLRPRRVEPRLLLAKLYLESQLTAEAEQCVRAALQDGVDDPRLHYWLGLVLVSQGRTDDARRHLEAYVRNRPDQRDAKKLLANLLAAEALRLEMQITPGQLRAYADRIDKLDPEDPKGLLVRAAALSRGRPKLEDFRSAIELLERARQRLPDDVDVRRRLASAHRDLGWQLQLTKREDPAMEHFRAFLDLATPDLRTEAVQRVLRGHCLKLQDRGIEALKAGNGKAAEREFERLTQLSPARPDGHFQLGLARLNQQRLEPALASFESAVRLGRELREDVSFYMLPLLDTLKMLGRGAEMKRRGSEYLAACVQADPRTVAKIRRLLE